MKLWWYDYCADDDEAMMSGEPRIIVQLLTQDIEIEMGTNTGSWAYHQSEYIINL